MPPPVNNLFSNGRSGAGRFPTKRYTAWKKAAAAMLVGQWRPSRPISYPVSIVACVTHKSRSDLDNLLKAPLDFLVQQGILADDSKSIVKRITIEWADVAGITLYIERV